MIDKHILKLQEMQGFYNEWISRLPYTKTHEEAYNMTEDFYMSNFGKTRFKNFESFKSSVSQWLKKRNDSKNR